MYLQKIIKKEVIYGLLHAIEKDVRISLNVMHLKKGMPPDYVLMSLVITLR